jgi:ribosomal protein L11 methyltransferase
MAIQYLEIKINVAQEFSEILIAELTNIGFDSFLETETGIDAYVDQTLFNETEFLQLLERYRTQVEITYTSSILENKNWNEEWEKNFEPVIISDECIVRASFHHLEKPYKYDIVINPKMSFGTGHHETTSMMIEHQLENDHKDKIIMDAGSGTGILAIMASKLGAFSVDAFDIEDWTFENLKENVILNNWSNVYSSLGHIENAALRHEKYDIILANINRNILLAEMPMYKKRLKADGKLILSGFYKEDIPVIESKAQEYSLNKKSVKEKNNWVSVVFM